MRKIYLHKRFDSFNLVTLTFEAILPQITSNYCKTRILKDWGY